MGISLGAGSHLARMQILPTSQCKRTEPSCNSSVPARLLRLQSLSSYPKLFSPTFFSRMPRGHLLLQKVSAKVSNSIEWENSLFAFRKSYYIEDKMTQYLWSCWLRALFWLPFVSSYPWLFSASFSLPMNCRSDLTLQKKNCIDLYWLNNPGLLFSFIAVPFYCIKKSNETESRLCLYISHYFLRQTLLSVS